MAVMEGGLTHPGWYQPSAVLAGSGQDHLPPKQESPHIPVFPQTAPPPRHPRPSSSPSFFRSEVIWSSLSPNNQRIANAPSLTVFLASAQTLRVLSLFSEVSTPVLVLSGLL